MFTGGSPRRSPIGFRPLPPDLFSGSMGAPPRFSVDFARGGVILNETLRMPLRPLPTACTGDPIMTPPFRTDHSAALYERACRSLATGVSSSIRRNVTPVPLYFERADGPYFFDADGHRLLDYTLAWGPLIVGSNHPVLNARVVEQLGRAYTFGAQHEGEILLAEQLTQIVPGVEQVIFASSGTEVVQSALRLARAHTGRDLIVKFEGHYHGWMNNVLVSYRPKATDPIATLPACAGQPACEYGATLVLPWNDLDALARAFAEHPGQIAAVLTEPMLANSGSCMPRDGYLQGLVDLCREHGAVSIFDEVITGFRVALGGAREFFGVLPDLSIYGKAIAAGFTLSAVGGRRALFDVLRAGRTVHAGTYNGHPVNIAAALATLEVLGQPGTFERMHAHGRAIRAALEASAARHGRRLVTTGVGTVFSVQFGLDEPPRDYRDTLRADTAAGNRFRAEMLARGVQLLPEGRWYVGAAHGEAELKLVLPAIEESMKALAG
jgi:glutamate-1-semialdehyde 2,1-aminomutase